jgi:hypothetical protein
MRLKATWSLLLLVLVSVQAFAATCDVQCGAMAMMESASHMSGMSDCPGMASQTLPGQQTVAAVAPPQLCDSHICKDDWTFLQNPDVYELSITSLPLALPGNTVIALEIARPVQFKTDRSPHPIPAFDPLISSLRV